MIMKKYMVAAAILAGLAFTPAMAQTKPTIAVIVKDTNSPFWQTVFAGARKTGLDLGANVVELGAQSASDAVGQISILKKAVAFNPAAIMTAPAKFPRLASPSTRPPRKSKSSASTQPPTPRQ
jgi:ribose transport system substrate-binding protein